MSGSAARRLLPAVVGLILIVGIVIVAGVGGSADSADNTDLSKKPVMVAHDGAPPTKLVSTDLVEGTGATAKSGSQLTVKYVGALYDTGEEFDSSWDRGQPFPFQLGTGAVIPGWDQGITGMKEGGRRELIIPPDLAYGAQGSPPSIGPNATLDFIVDLVSVK